MTGISLDSIECLELETFELYLKQEVHEFFRELKSKKPSNVALKLSPSEASSYLCMICLGYVILKS